MLEEYEQENNEERKRNIEKIRSGVPHELRQRFTPKAVNKMLERIDDEESKDSFIENLIDFSALLGDGRYSHTAFVNAVKFVTYRLMDRSKLDCYKLTFPDKYERMLEAGRDKNHIATVAWRYANGKLPTDMMKQARVELSVIFTAERVKVATELSKIALYSPKELNRIKAAEVFLTHTAPPDEGMQLDVNVTGDDTIQKLTQLLSDQAIRQKEKIITGEYTAAEVAGENPFLVEESGS